MEPLGVIRCLMGKPKVPSTLGERLTAGCGLLLMAVGFWAMWAGVFAPAERHVPETWWANWPAYLFAVSIVLSIAHKILIIRGAFVSPLGLASVLVMMVVIMGQPLAMAAAGQSFQSSSLLFSEWKEWMAVGGLVVGGVWVDVFTWMYERIRQGENARRLRE